MGRLSARCLTALLSFILVECHAERAKPCPEPAELSLPVFDSEATGQLHVQTSSERMALSREGEPSFLTAAVGFRGVVADEINFVLPVGYELLRSEKLCGILRDDKPLKVHAEEPRNMVDLATANPMVNHISSCEILGGGADHRSPGDARARAAHDELAAAVSGAQAAAQIARAAEAHERSWPPEGVGISFAQLGATSTATANQSALPMPGLPNSGGVAAHVPPEQGSEAKAPMSVRLTITQGVAGLSLGQKSESVGAEAWNQVTWWYFRVSVWNPDFNPPTAENKFQLHWFSQDTNNWKGSLLFNGWPILGDWDCAYTEWEGWGSCTANCGGGVQRLRRRVRWAPPPGGKGKPCTEPLVKEDRCNERPCQFPCQFEPKVEKGICSAECGGGVRTVRRIWHGDDCPAGYDQHAVSTEICNTLPCTASCRLSDQWDVVTECSQRCGKGFYWAVRAVEYKDPEDDSCLEEWEMLPCVRKECEDMIVDLPEANIIAFPNDISTVVITFKIPSPTRLMELQAPDGYRFVVDSKGKCTLYSHDLSPHFDDCVVGSVPSRATLNFATALPQNDANDGTDRWEFQIKVKNMPCTKFSPDIMQEVLICDVDPDSNQWQIQYAAQGRESWGAIMSQGYDLYSPTSIKFQVGMHGRVQGEEVVWFADKEDQEKHKIGPPSVDKAKLLMTQQSADKATKQFAEAAEELMNETAGERPEFCSIRRPCKKEHDFCADSGVCMHLSKGYGIQAEDQGRD